MPGLCRTLCESDGPEGPERKDRQDMLARNSTDSPERLFVEALSTDWVFSCKVADDSFDVSLKRKPSDRNDVLGLGLTDP